MDFRSATGRFLGFCLVLFSPINIDATQFTASDVTAEAGGAVAVGINVRDFSGVQAFQFSFRWDPQVIEFSGLSDFGVADLREQNFAVFPEQGVFSVVWDGDIFDGETLADGSELFRVRFQVVGASSESSVLRFVDDPTTRLVVQNFQLGVFNSGDGRVLVGSAPTIEGPDQIQIQEDQESELIPLVFSDDATPANELVVSILSDDETLIAPDGIILDGDGANRNLRLRARPDQAGSTVIRIRATDDTGGVREKQMEVTVVAVNDPPRAVADLLEIDEDSPAVSVAVLDNDSFAPDLDDSIALLNVDEVSAMGGIVTVVDGVVHYEPHPNFSGNDRFDYTIVDSFGAEATATVTVNVIEVNDPPSPEPDELVVDEDSGAVFVPVLVNDSVAPDEGETLVLRGVSLGDQGGMTEIRDGDVFYRPAANFFGLERFTYDVGDGNGGTASAEVLVRVQPINDPPEAKNDGVSVPEDSLEILIDVLVNDSILPDVDEVLQIIEVSQGASGGVTRLGEGGILYRPPSNFFGRESFQYSISDGNGGTASAEVAVTVVNDRADSPVARDDRFNLPEDSEDVFLAVLDDNGSGRDFDPDGDTLFVTFVEFVDGGQGVVAISEEGDGVLYQPAANFVGSETLRYTISDGEFTASAVVFVTVSDGNNDPPLVFDDRFVVSEDSIGVRLDVLEDNGSGEDRDPEGEALRVSVLTESSLDGRVLTVADDGRALIYSPPRNFAGIDRFDYLVSDGELQSRGRVEVEVVNIDDDPPRVRDDLLDVVEDTIEQPLHLLADNGNGTDADPEGMPLVIISVEGLDEFSGTVSIAVDGGLVFYTPQQDFVGEERIRYLVTDGTHQVGAVATIRVSNVDDDPPVVIGDHFEVAEDAVDVALSVLEGSAGERDYDPEGEVLRVVDVTPNGDVRGRIEVGILGDTVVYTPAPNFVGEERFLYEVSDGSLTAQGEIVITVVNANDDPPIAVADEFQVEEDSVANLLSVLDDHGLGADSDVDGDDLVVTRVEPEEGFLGVLSLEAEGRGVIYAPAENFSGIERFRYSISDGQTEVEATVTVEVVNVDDDPPFARADEIFVLTDGGPVDLAVLDDNGLGVDFDPEGESLTIVAIPESTPGSDLVAINADLQSIRYVPSPGFVGTDRFSYSITDGANFTEATVTVFVTSADNNAPEARDDQFVVAEDTDTASLPVLADNGNGADLDLDGDRLQVFEVDRVGSGGGQLKVSSDHQQVEYRPAPDFDGTETFAYTVSDGVLTSRGVVTVVVTPVPDPPMIERLEEVSVDQGASLVSLHLSITDPDSALETLVVSATADNDQLVPATGLSPVFQEGRWVLNIRPVPALSGLALITVVVSDGVLESRRTIDFSVAEVQVIRGRSVGGLVYGGEVFLDLDFDGELDVQEPVARVDGDGNYELSVRLRDVDRNGNRAIDETEGRIRSIGGRALLTGTAPWFDWEAPVGVSVVSPLSTLAAELIERDTRLNSTNAMFEALGLLGLELEGSGGTVLNSLDWYHPDQDSSASLGVALRSAWFESLVGLTVSFFEGIDSALRRDSFEHVIQLFSIQGAEALRSSQAIKLFLERIESKLEASVVDDVRSFVALLIWEHLQRIDRLFASDLDRSRIVGELSRLTLFTAAELIPAIMSFGGQEEVHDSLRLIFSKHEINKRMEVYPQTNIAEDRSRVGEFRFLYEKLEIDELGGSLQVPLLIRDGGSLGGQSLSISVSSGSAEVGVDLNDRVLTVNFDDGERYKLVDAGGFILDDQLEEGAETANINLFDGEGRQIRSSELLILDNESPGIVEFSSLFYELEEDGPQPVVFLVRRGGGLAASSRLVRFGVNDEGVSVDFESDLLAPSVSVELREGEKVSAVHIPLVTDFVVEADEDLKLILGEDLDGASVDELGAQDIATLRVLNDDFRSVPEWFPIREVVTEEDTPLVIEVELLDETASFDGLEIEAFSLNKDILKVGQIQVSDAGGILLELLPETDAFGGVEVILRVADARQTIEETFSVMVTPVDDRPLLFQPPSDPVIYVEDGAPVGALLSLVVLDVDGGNLDRARVAIRRGLQPGSDRLVFGNGPGAISGFYDPVEGVLELAGRSTVAEYETALRRVLFDNRSNNPTILPRIIEVTVFDGEWGSLTAQAAVVVQPVNDAPEVLGLERERLVYLENGPELALSNSLLVATVDDQVLFEAVVQVVENYVEGEDVLEVQNLPSGLSAEFDPILGRLTIRGSREPGVYQNALRAVRYRNVSEDPSPVVRRISFQLKDSDLFSPARERELEVVPIEDPARILPIPQQSLILGQTLNVPIEIIDPDSEVGLPEVRIVAENPNLVAVSGIAEGDRPGGFVIGLVSDGRHVGAGRGIVSVGEGDSRVRSVFEFQVVAPGLAPTITGPRSVVSAEDQSIALSFLFSDPDDDPGELELEVSIDNQDLFPPGSILLTRVGGAAFVELRPLPHRSGVASLRLFVSDRLRSAEWQVAIEVLEQNDLPIVEGLSHYAIDAGSELTIPLQITDVETLLDQLVVGVRVIEGASPELFSFEIRGRGEARELSIRFENQLVGLVELELVVVDGDGGIARVPFSVRLVRSESAPRLVVRRLEGAEIELSWEGPGDLVTTRTLGGPYVPIPEAVSPWRVSLEAEAGFYRVLSLVRDPNGE